MLTSIKLPIEDIGNMVQSQTQPVQSAVQKLQEINPAEVFPTDQMLSFKSSLKTKLESFVETPSGLSGLRSQLDQFNPQQLSSALYNAGFEIDDIDDFDFSTESLTDITNSLSTAINQAAGGCPDLLNAKRQITSPIQLSLGDLDIGNAVSGFVGGVARDVTSLLEASSKSVQSIASDLVGSAESLAGSVKDAVTELSTINPSDLIKFAEDSVNQFTSSIDSAISSLSSGIKIDVNGLLNVTSGCTEATKASVETQAKNIGNSIEKLTEKLPGVGAEIVESNKESLNNLKKTAENFITESNIANVKTQTVGNTKLIDEKNIDAVRKEIENLAKTQTVQANEDRDAKINRALNYAKDKTKKTEANFNDLITASLQRSFDPARVGREVVKRDSVIKESNEFINVTVFDATYFSPSKYKAEIATKINTLNPDLRKKVADAIREFIQKYNSEGWEIRITSALRSIQEQQVLYDKLKPQGKLVAVPGNSWHNYGMAVDIALIYNNKYQSSAASYNGLAKPIFAKYGLHNPFSNDEIHFQPTQITLSPKNIKDKLLVAGRVNVQAVSSLIT